MARRIGDNQRPVMLTADAVRRIGKVVQSYEQGTVNIKAKPLRTAYGDDGGEPLRIARAPDAWPKGTLQNVTTIYKISCEDEDINLGSGEQELEVWNRLFDIPADALVYIGKATNGCWHVVAAGCGGGGSGSDGCECPSIGGQDVTTLPGYDAEQIQVLSHSFGCLQWITTTDCDSGSS